MTTDTKLLPLYAELQGHPKLEIIKHYARANVAHATAPLQAEIEALRAEVGRAWKAEDEWRRVANTNGGRAEQLAEALRGKASEWEAWGADPDHPIAGCPQDERANEIFQRCANELRALLRELEQGK